MFMYTGTLLHSDDDTDGRALLQLAQQHAMSGMTMACELPCAVGPRVPGPAPRACVCFASMYMPRLAPVVGEYRLQPLWTELLMAVANRPKSVEKTLCAGSSLTTHRTKRKHASLEDTQDKGYVAVAVAEDEEEEEEEENGEAKEGDDD